MATQIKAEHLEQLYKMLEHLKDNEDDYLLILEKLVYLLVEYLDYESASTLSFEPKQVTKEFVELVNKKTVQAFTADKIEEAMDVIGRVAELLKREETKRIYMNQEELDEAKILTLNNICCIHRKMNKYDIAIRVIDLAISLEERLAKMDYGFAKVSIISTYLNKCALCSERNRNKEAAEAALKGLKAIDEAEKKRDIGADEQEHLQRLRILCNYHLGVEYEKLNEKSKALSYIETAIK